MRERFEQRREYQAWKMLKKTLLVFACYALLWPVLEWVIGVPKIPWFPDLLLIGLALSAYSGFFFSIIHLPLLLLLRFFWQQKGWANSTSTNVFAIVSVLVAIPATIGQQVMINYLQGGYDQGCIAKWGPDDCGNGGIKVIEMIPIMLTSILTAYAAARAMTRTPK